MSLIFLDSFDHYSTPSQKGWALTSNIGGTGIVTAAARTGVRGFRANFSAGNLAGISRFFSETGASDDEVIIGFGFRLSANPGTARHIFKMGENGVVYHLTATIDPATSKINYSVAGGVQAGTIALAASAYYYIECRIKVADSPNGQLEVHINGVTDINVSGIDTRNSASGSGVINLVDLGPNATPNTGVATFDYDDFYYVAKDGVGVTNFIGDCKVECILPTAEGASSSFTPSAGTDNALNVDENVPDDDTTYNSSSTVGHKDTHVMADLATTSGTVIGVQQTVRARKDDAGSRTLRQVIRSGGTDYEGADFSLADGYTDQRRVLEQNPNTAAAWTIAGVNGVEAGYKVQA